MGVQCAILWCSPVVLSGILFIRLAAGEAPVTGSGEAGDAGAAEHSRENSCRDAVLCHVYGAILSVL